MISSPVYFLAQILHHKIIWSIEKKMQYYQNTDYQKQIEDALKRAKNKKVLYFYDDSGHKRLLGVFDKKKAAKIKKYYRSKNKIDRLSEFEIRTTEPDTSFS